MIKKTLELVLSFIDAYLNRGITKTDIENYEGAISDFNMAISLDPQSGEEYFYKWAVYSKINKQTEAGKDWAETWKFEFKEPVGEKQKEE